MDITNVHLIGNLANGCSASLNGIQFNGAGGSLTHSSVANIRYGSGSGCQSGNSIDITNVGGATRLPVTVDDVQVTGFQKTGIRANGNVALRLTDSTVASSDLDLITASNSLQISRGARAYVADNTIAGNDWDGNADWNATGVLLYGAERRHVHPQRGQRHGHRRRPVRLRGGRLHRGPHGPDLQPVQPRRCSRQHAHARDGARHLEPRRSRRRDPHRQDRRDRQHGRGLRHPVGRTSTTSTAAPAPPAR